MWSRTLRRYDSNIPGLTVCSMDGNQMSVRKTPSAALNGRAAIRLNHMLAQATRRLRDEQPGVDPSFATRDLVRSLHRTPGHAVLVLNSREARLFEGAADQLRPARTSVFPLRDPPAPKRRRAP